MNRCLQNVMAVLTSDEWTLGSPSAPLGSGGEGLRVGAAQRCWRAAPRIWFQSGERATLGQVSACQCTHRPGPPASSQRPASCRLPLPTHVTGTSAAHTDSASVIAELKGSIFCHAANQESPEAWSGCTGDAHCTAHCTHCPPTSPVIKWPSQVQLLIRD